ncbi:MAG: tripartite tricarboxylate transporter substrate binding protein [Thermodesulfobacteriota bacterium]
MRRFIRFGSLIVTLFILASPWPGYGAEKYPTKAVNVVVPFPPGQTPDLIARALAEGAKGAFPQPFVIVNRPGGAGTLGVAEVVMARADGYTLRLSPIAPLIVQPQITSDLPYRRPGDYRPVMKTGNVPMVFAVRADSPWKSIQDVIDYAKANPGKMRVGSSGLGSIPHMDLEIFKEKAGVDITHVPFTGAAAHIPALLGGHIEGIADSLPPMLDQVRAGKLRVLGTFEEKRNTILPDVPTFRERGFDVTLGVYHSVIAPKGTPDSVIRTVAEGLKKAMDSEAFKKFVRSSNYVVDYLDGAALKKLLEADYEKMGPIITKLNLKK